MFERYQTNYSNEVHQLTIAVLKHYWVTKAGIVTYQQKPMELTLASAKNQGRTHLVLYVVRDHMSGYFYCRIASSLQLIDPVKFLQEAWAPKTEGLQGMPTHQAITDTVEEAFPGTRDAVGALGVSLPKVTSGFHGGIRDVRTIEQRLDIADRPISVAIDSSPSIGLFSGRQPSSHEKGLTISEHWRRNLQDNTTS